MRPVYKVILAVAALALLVRATPAQQPFGAGGVATLLASKDVQKELKLTDDQAAKASKVMPDIAQKHREDLAKLFLNPFPLTGDAEQVKKYVDTSRQVTDDTVSALGDSLKPEQVKRFKQLALQRTIQAVGAAVLMDPEAEKALKLTDKQKEDVKAAVDDLRKKEQAAIKDLKGDPADAFKKLGALNKESVEGIVKSFTDDQKKTWKDMVGDPFEFKAEKPGGTPEKKEPSKGDGA
jgi:hypothetical protein